MIHPYAPFIISALASVAVASVVFIWLCIRRDRRESEQHRWEKSTRTTIDDLTDRDIRRRFNRIVNHDDGIERP